jgi:hypothetical protein
VLTGRGIRGLVMILDRALSRQCAINRGERSATKSQANPASVAPTSANELVTRRDQSI